jgi:hypothetical protein
MTPSTGGTTPKGAAVIGKESSESYAWSMEHPASHVSTGKAWTTPAPGRWTHLPHTAEAVATEVPPYSRRPHAPAPRHHAVTPEPRLIRGERKKTTQAHLHGGTRPGASRGHRRRETFELEAEVGRA